MVTDESRRDRARRRVVRPFARRSGERPSIQPPPNQAHRLLSALGAASVLHILSGPWQLVVTHSALVGIVIGLSFVIVLAALALACVARSGRALSLVDAVVLAVGAAATAVSTAPYILGRRPSNVDEKLLTDRATRLLAAGHDPYRFAAPHLVARYPTPLLNGHVADRFGYPPLMPLVAAGVHRVLPGVESPTVLTGLLAAVVTAVILFVMLPRWARPLAVLAVFTVSVMPELAIGGYPIVIALPFLVLAVARWTDIGRGGRLGRWGIVQAVALGLAATAQQEAWFVIPFLAVGLWCVRRGELDTRRTAAVLARWAGLVTLPFVLVNLPFVIVGPHRWVGGVLDPLTQHSIFFGPGISNFTSRLVGGSGDLGLYGIVGLGVAATALLVLGFSPRRFAAAAVVLPFVLFWFTLRSQALYYEVGIPPALLAITTLDRTALVSARPLWGTGRHRVLRLALPMLTAVVAAGAFVAALSSPAPLSLRVLGVETSPYYHRLTGLEVKVRNTSDHRIEPHFVTTVTYIQSLFWRVESGPGTLAPGQQATYRLLPSRLQGPPIPPLLRRADLWVVSDDPQTLSSVGIPRLHQPGGAPVAGLVPVHKHPRRYELRHDRYRRYEQKHGAHHG